MVRRFQNNYGFSLRLSGTCKSYATAGVFLAAARRAAYPIVIQGDMATVLLGRGRERRRPCVTVQDTGVGKHYISSAILGVEADVLFRQVATQHCGLRVPFAQCDR